MADPTRGDEANAGSVTSVPPDIPLTALGRRQAERIARVMAEPPALIVTSPYRRAQQTAEPTIARFPDVPREEWPVQEFTFLGDLHGRPTSAADRKPHAAAYWARADPHEAVDGAESFADLIGRVRALMDRLTTQPAGPIAVFTHAVFIKAVAWSRLTGTTTPPDREAMRRFRVFADGFVVPNAGVTELHRTDHAAPRLLGGVAW